MCIRDSTCTAVLCLFEPANTCSVAAASDEIGFAEYTPRTSAAESRTDADFLNLIKSSPQNNLLEISVRFSNHKEKYINSKAYK